MTNAQYALQAAIDSLGAVEVAPGYYAWEQMGRWYVSPAEEMTADAIYSPATMPAWWTPEYQWGIRLRSDGRVVTTCPSANGTALDNRILQGTVITADLATGEERPC